ncbi:MAG: cytidylate kinase-like family protein, partial [Candidatus Rokubacteria bacterium]|nr:cytidylate kinase-like family protein [Candidatus Rokubacteria bacterium]
MSIVAISETLGSLGTEIGRRVAAARGFELADREIIAKAAERFHEGIGELTHVTEERPTLWERFTDTQRRYMTYVEAILLELAARDNVVLVGRAATLLLRGVGHAMRVRVSAPEDVRAARLQHEQGLTPEAA